MAYSKNWSDSLALSKTIAHALRHQPEMYKLEPDEHGWVPVNDLLASLQQHGRPNLTLAEIQRIVDGQKRKVRYEFDETRERIRATHGHSFSSRIQYEPATPPEVLYHGTSPEAAKAIMKSGQLKPMGRQYVHLSSDRKTAKIVGRRKARKAAILQIDAKQASEEAAVKFYGPMNENIWLSDSIPTKYISEIKDK